MLQDNINGFYNNKCFLLLLNNLGISFNLRDKLANEILNLKSNSEYLKIDHQGLKKFINYVKENNEDITKSMINESEMITVQRGFVIGKLKGVIY